MLRSSQKWYTSYDGIKAEILANEQVAPGHARKHGTSCLPKLVCSAGVLSHDARDAQEFLELAGLPPRAAIVHPNSCISGLQSLSAACRRLCFFSFQCSRAGLRNTPWGPTNSFTTSGSQCQSMITSLRQASPLIPSHSWVRGLSRAEVPPHEMVDHHAILLEHA